MLKDQKGFSVAEAFIIIIVIAGLSGVGYYVYQHRDKSDDSKKSQKESKKEEQEHTEEPKEDETASWKQVESIGGAFTIRVPDGWQLHNYAGNTLNGDNITYTKGQQATITTESNEYGGDQRKFNVTVHNEAFQAPQWASPNQYGTESNSDFSIGDLQGKKYSIEFTQTVTGVTAGDRIYQYVFNLSDGRQLSVAYLRNAGDADNLERVEQAIKTIAVK